jgi:hypothetical protein
MTFVDTISAIVRMISQTVMLFSVLRGQQDGLSYALLTFSSNLLSYMNFSITYQLSRSRKAFTLYAFTS